MERHQQLALDLPAADGDWWYIADVAAHWGITRKTVYWYLYQTRHNGKEYLPPPDDPGFWRPRWRPATIRNFQRPGPTAPGVNTREGRPQGERHA